MAREIPGVVGCQKGKHAPSMDEDLGAGAGERVGDLDPSKCEPADRNEIGEVGASTYAARHDLSGFQTDLPQNRPQERRLPFGGLDQDESGTGMTVSGIGAPACFHCSAKALPKRRRVL